MARSWEAWIDAGAWLQMNECLVADFAERVKDPRGLSLPCMVLGRFQASTEIAIEELEAAWSSRSPDDADTTLLDYQREARNVHSLVVSAHQFWSLVGTLRGYLSQRDWFSRAYAKSEEGRLAARGARHHFEHFAERIVKGRLAGYQKGVDEMPTEVFRQACGILNEAVVTFGHESFDLRVIAQAVTTFGNEVAPKLAKACIPEATIRIKVRRERDARTHRPNGPPSGPSLANVRVPRGGSSATLLPRGGAPRHQPDATAGLSTYP